MRLSFLTSKLLESEGFVHGFTTRIGGTSKGPFESLNVGFDIGDETSNVQQNLNLLKQEIGLELPLSRVKQVHGANVVTAAESSLPEWHLPPTLEADGIIGQEESIIAVQTADCAPVLFACPTTRRVAAIHAGWRGASNGLLRKAIRQLRDLGSPTNSLLAAIGPCIHFPCYEVGDEVAKVLPESADPAPKKPGKHLLDLVNAIEVSLIVEGVPSERIESVGDCTHCATEQFFSYRKSGGETGRMLGFITGHPAK